LSGGGLACHTKPNTSGPLQIQAISDGDDVGRRAHASFYEHAALHQALRHEILGHADVLYRKRPDKE
jgi:hypothetical protein